MRASLPAPLCLPFHLYLFACHPVRLEWFYTCTVSHQRSTARAPAAPSDGRETVCLVIEPGPITKSAQVSICVRVSVQELAWGHTTWHATAARSYWVWSATFCVLPSSSEDSWPRRFRAGMSKAHRDVLGWCSEAETESMLAWEKRCEVKARAVNHNLFLTLRRQKKGWSHRPQSRRWGEETAARKSKTKQNKKTINSPPNVC